MRVDRLLGMVIVHDLVKTVAGSLLPDLWEDFEQGKSEEAKVAWHWTNSRPRSSTTRRTLQPGRPLNAAWLGALPHSRVSTIFLPHQQATLREKRVSNCAGRKHKRAGNRLRYSELCQLISTHGATRRGRCGASRSTPSSARHCWRIGLAKSRCGPCSANLTPATALSSAAPRNGPRSGSRPRGRAGRAMASATAIGAYGRQKVSSSGPAAAWIAPQTPLPALAHGSATAYNASSVPTVKYSSLPVSII